MFLGFSLFAITTCTVVFLIFYWTPLFQEVRDHCHYGIEHPKHARLLWLVILTDATWFLAALTYSRDFSAVWNTMKVSQREDGERGFTYTITQTYFFVLVICGGLYFIFTSWFLYHNRRKFPNLIKIIRFNAVRSDSDNDLENGRNDQWEMDTAHPEEDDQAYSDTTTWDEYDPFDGTYLCNEDHRHGWTCPKTYGDFDWNRGGNERKDKADWPAKVELVDNEGKGDNVPGEDDPAGSGHKFTGREDEQDQNDWCRLCWGYHARDLSCSSNKDEDQHDWSRSNNGSDALRLTPSSSGSDAEANTSTAPMPTEASVDPHDWSRIHNDLHSRDEGEDQHDCPKSNNERGSLHLTPSSSGSDVPVNTTTPGPPNFNNWYTAPNDAESCSSCDSEHTKTIPMTRPAAYREPLTPTSPAAPLATYASDADANAEDTDAVGSCDQTTRAQEQRPRPTGLTFFPPGLAARDPRVANVLADETGHGQGPPVGEFRHGITRPLRLIMPTDSFGNADPRAPTTPVNAHSPVEWPSSACVRHSCWRDV